MKRPRLMSFCLLLLPTFISHHKVCAAVKSDGTFEVIDDEDYASRRYKGAEPDGRADQKEPVRALQNEDLVIVKKPPPGFNCKCPSKELGTLDFSLKDSRFGQHPGALTSELIGPAPLNNHFSDIESVFLPNQHRSFKRNGRSPDVDSMYRLIGQTMDTLVQADSGLKTSSSFSWKHPSIFISKLEGPARMYNQFLDMQFSNDPMFHVIDQMVDSLMLPILPRAFKKSSSDSEPLDSAVTAKCEIARSAEDSSLKQWMLEDDNGWTSDARADDSNVQLCSTESKDYADYRIDLWKKFNTQETTDSSAVELHKMQVDVSNVAGSENQTVKENTTCGKSKSNYELSQDPVRSQFYELSQDPVRSRFDLDSGEQEETWWHRLISPRKPVILKHRKKNTIQGNPAPLLPMLNRQTNDMIESRANDMKDRNANDMNRDVNGMMFRNANDMIDRPSNDMMDKRVNNMMERHASDMMDRHANDMMDRDPNNMMDRRVSNMMERHANDMDRDVNDMMDRHANDMMDRHVNDMMDRDVNDMMDRQSNDSVLHDVYPESKHDDRVDSRSDASHYQSFVRSAPLALSLALFLLLVLLVKLVLTSYNQCSAVRRSERLSFSGQAPFRLKVKRTLSRPRITFSPFAPPSGYSLFVPGPMSRADN